MHSTVILLREIHELYREILYSYLHSIIISPKQYLLYACVYVVPQNETFHKTDVPSTRDETIWVVWVFLHIMYTMKSVKVKSLYRVIKKTDGIFRCLMKYNA